MFKQFSIIAESAKTSFLSFRLVIVCLYKMLTMPLAFPTRSNAATENSAIDLFRNIYISRGCVHATPSELR